MKDSEIYLEAARLVANGRTAYSCIAIDYASGEGTRDWSRQTTRYQVLFRNRASVLLDVLDAEWAGGREWRILALCLMAAIAESEER